MIRVMLSTLQFVTKDFKTTYEDIRLGLGLMGKFFKRALARQDDDENKYSLLKSIFLGFIIKKFRESLLWRNL